MPEYRQRDQYWNGRFERPVHISIPPTFFMDRVTELIRAHQLQVFGFWSDLMNEELDLIPDESIFYGMAQLTENFPSLYLFTLQQEFLEEENSELERFTLLMMVLLQEATPNENYRKSFIYLHALKSLFETIHAGELFVGWPPGKRELPEYTKPNTLIKQVNIVTPTSQYLVSQIGIQPVLELHIQYFSPIIF